MSSNVARGRVAGVVYLGVVATGIFSLAYAPSQIFVSGDDAAAAAAIVEKRGLFLALIASGIAMSAFYLALPFALARFLSAHGRTASRAMILLVAASIPFMLIAYWRYWEMASGATSGALTPEAVGALRAEHNSYMDVASIFWGLWLAPLGFLVLKSGSIPRMLGVLLLCGCAGYVANYFGPRFFDGYESLSFMSHVSRLGSIGEIGTCLWLLVRGAR